MQRASQQTTDAMGRINGALDVVRTSILALGVGATVGAFAVVIKGAIDAADNLRDMSQKTGVAVEALNGLGFAAGQAGGSLESIVGAAGKLNKAIAEAAGGNKETAEAFKALGISVLDASGNLKKADVVMAEVADQFIKYQDGPEKAALALRLFGKAGADMIPMLNDGGDALRENTAYAAEYSHMTTELSNAADNFNDTMGKLTLQQTGFVNTITASVLPVLQILADEMVDAAEKGNKFSVAGEAARTVLEAFVVLGSEVAFTFRAVGTEIGGTAAQLAALGNTDVRAAFRNFTFIGDAMKRDAAIARTEHDAFIARVLERKPVMKPGDSAWESDFPASSIKPPAPRLTSTAPAKKTDAQRDAEKALQEGARMVAKLKEQDEAYGKSGTALLEYQLAGMKIPQVLKDQALAHQANIDAMKSSELASESFRKEQQDALQAMEDAAKRATEKNAQDVARIRFEQMSGGQIEVEAHAARMEALQLRHDEELLSLAEFNAMIEVETQRHAKAKFDIKAATEQSIVSLMSDSSNQLYSVLKQAGMEQTALGKAAFLASKALAVAQIILSTNVAAATALAPPPFGLGPVLGLGLAGIIKGMGYASAAMTAGLAIAEASAEGGYDIPAGTNPLTQLHEKEMVLPRAQADVIRGLASRGGGGGGGPVVHQTNNIHIDSSTDQAKIYKIVAGAVQQGNADLVDKLARAGRI